MTQEYHFEGLDSEITILQVTTSLWLWIVTKLDIGSWQLEEKELDLTYVPTEDQVADVLTKRISAGIALQVFGGNGSTLCGLRGHVGVC